MTATTFSNKYNEAIAEDDVETVQACLAGGPGINDFDTADGYTALHKACKVRAAVRLQGVRRGPSNGFLGGSLNASVRGMC
jgi:hypothetical protein